MSISLIDMGIGSGLCFVCTCGGELDVIAMVNKEGEGRRVRKAEMQLKSVAGLNRSAGSEGGRFPKCRRELVGTAANCGRLQYS